MSCRTASLLVCLCLSAPAMAQELPPALMVRLPQADGQPGPSKPVGLSEVKVEARVFGFLAETKMTMTFFNPHDRVLEGSLYFPLPEGATVSGYALDVNGVMVDGVVVEKEKAQVVFEKEMRKGVDPGIVEWVKGSNFKTRVYPLPARGRRTVSVTYVSGLVQGKDGLAYQLPLSFKHKLDRFELRVEVVQPSATPRVKWDGPGTFALQTRAGSSFAELALKNEPLQGHLLLALPQTAPQEVMVEASPRAETLFALSDVQRDPRTKPQAMPAPKRVTLLWDASGSRPQSNLSRELALLDAYFKRFTDGTIDVDLVVFRDQAAQPRRFKVVRGRSAALRKALQSVAYDGGTQLGAISPAAKGAAPDLYLLFSDGLSNFGVEQAQGFRAPLYAFSTAPGANHALLKHLSQSTGGAYYNISHGRIDDAAARVGSATFSLLSVKVDSGKVSELMPSGGVPASGRVFVSGKLESPRAALTLRYGVGGKVLKEVKVTVDATRPAEGDLLSRFWAQMKMSELVVSPRRNHEALVALGKRYGLVTPGTSLIVLETFEQYLEHEIVPPKSLRDWRNRYAQIMDERAAAKKQEDKEKLDAILALWKERVEWWNTKFTYPKNYRHGESAPKKSRRRAAPDMAPEAEMADGNMVEESTSGGAMGAAAPSPSLAREDAKEKKKDEAGPEQGVQAAISLKPWDPQTPYIQALKAAPPARRFGVYLQQKREFGSAPAFYLDCADFFYRSKQIALAVQVLSNLAELELENAALLRVLAHRLAQLEALDLAAPIFEEVLRLRPEEPQSWRDLAMVLARQEKYERAMELLAHVVMNRWDRFDQIEVIALMELNNIIPRARNKGIRKIPIDKRLIKKLDVDVRIVLTWDADLTDIDMWVIEPSGEKAYYGNPRSHIGGLVSRDFTQGYGPEEYSLRRAMHGTYKVQTNFFGSSAQSLSGAVTLQLDLYTNYGRPNEQRKSITVRLTENKETLTIGEIEL